MDLASVRSVRHQHRLATNGYGGASREGKAVRTTPLHEFLRIAGVYFFQGSTSIMSGIVPRELFPGNQERYLLNGKRSADTPTSRGTSCGTSLASPPWGACGGNAGR